MKRITGIVLAAVLVVGLGAFLVVRSAADKVTDDMLSRAARFSIPADWNVSDEIIRPEQFPCISTNPCPSLYRQWDAGKELTEEEVEAIYAGVGFEMVANRPCQRPSNAIGVSTICIIEGADGEYRYLLTLISPDPNESHLVALVVEPRRRKLGMNPGEPLDPGVSGVFRWFVDRRGMQPIPRFFRSVPEGVTVTRCR